MVGDPNQQTPITAEDKRTIIEDYLGICFLGEGGPLFPDQPYDVRFELIYYPEVDYGALVTGATFTIREGGKIVGFGRVSMGVESAAA